MKTECHDNQMAEADQLGVVILWVDRDRFGHYGYLVPYRGYNTQAIFYFDKYSLWDQNEPIAEGSLVHYQTKTGQDDSRIEVVNIQVERFDSHQPQLDFRSEDVFGFPKLNPNDPIGEYLIKGLSPEMKIILECYYHGEVWAEIPPELLKYLNTVIGGPLLFDKQRFKKTKLRRLTQLLLNIKPVGSELAWLNRLLLEDVFPDSFSAKPENVDCSAPIYQASVVKLDIVDRHGCLKLSNGKRFIFSFDYFPTDDLVPQTGELVECRIYDELIPYDIWKVSPQTKPSANPGKLDASTCGLMYDRDTGKLILPNGTTIQFEHRYAEVFSAMLKKIPGQSGELFTKLDHKWVARFFERGKLRDEQPKLDERELNLKLKSVYGKIDIDPKIATKTAREFKRQFGKMLKRERVNFSVNDVIAGRGGSYTLGPGWDKKTPVIGGSEVALVNEHSRDND